MSISCSNGDPMNHPPLRNMILKDNILCFKKLKGVSINELWMRFKSLLLQCKTHGILDKMLSGCFYTGLGKENKGLTDQISPSGLTRLPYTIATQLLDHMANTNKETKKDQILGTMLTQLDLMDKQIMEL